MAVDRLEKSKSGCNSSGAIHSPANAVHPCEIEGIEFQRRVYAALDLIGICNVPDSNNAPLRPRAACRDFFSIFRHIRSVVEPHFRQRFI